MATQHTRQKTRDEPSAERNVLEATNVSVAFAMEHGDARVLDGVPINIRRGKVLGVIGESGLGKLMLTDSMFDTTGSPGTPTGDVVLNPPEGGEPIKANELSKEELRRFCWERVSMMAQGVFDSFNPTFSIGNHFVETFRVHDYDIQEGMEHARQLISDVYLEPDRVFDACLHELSGGMEQRALIVLDLILDPDVLMMDGPAAALDLLIQQSILKLPLELRIEYDFTITIVTHDLSHVARISDRFAVVHVFEPLKLGPVQGIAVDPTRPHAQELLNSTPDIDADLDEMVSVERMSPGPLNVPKSRSYRTRYPLADERCRATNPDLMEASDDHGAARFYMDKACETIPLKKEASE